MKITFLGAAETVTGAKYLLETHHKKILVDCGLFQGFKELRTLNWAALPVNPASIDAVILTHAHIDHSGYLPLLVKNGFKGPIYCTSGTRDLCSVLLIDSGHLQEEDARLANRYGYSKHHPALPLYTVKDAELALKQFRAQSYDSVYEIFDSIQVEFKRAGHIIGSSFVRIHDETTSVLFTGDIGRPQDLIMKEPSLIQQIDYLVMESTYGNRVHDKTHPKEKLKDVINKTVQRGGTIIIPTFAVARAQSLLHFIALLKAEKSIPDVPVYLDSPMAIDATDILCHHKEDHRLSDQECKTLCKTATYIRTPEESKQLDFNRFPKIILAASGMATGGRVLFHIKTYAPHHENTILFAGYQVGGTRGARMIQGEAEIKIQGQLVPIRAQVESLTNISAHADSDEILQWLSHFRQPPKKVFIIHGEREAAHALKSKIELMPGWSCIVPHYQQSVNLT